MEFQFYNKSTVSTRHRTEEGFLDVGASIYRSGLFEFRRNEIPSDIPGELSDRETIIVNVPDAVIRDEDFLNSVIARPVTDGHPSEFVNVKTARYLTRGVSMGPATVEPAGDVVLANAALRIVDEDLVREIEEGVREEVSIGNSGFLRWETGVRNGRTFDAILENIRVNHIAIVNRGRGGPAVRLHNERQEMKRTINGTEFLFAEDNVAAVDSLLATLANFETALGTAKAEIENLKTALAAAESEKTDETQVENMVNERIATIETARRISKDLDVSGSTREIQVRAIQTVNSELVSDSSSNEVVAAVFATLAKVDRTESRDAAAKIQNAIDDGAPSDEVTKARNERRERRRNQFHKANFGGK